MPMKLILFAAFSGAPKIVMYGFAAVCKMDKPDPIVNKPIKNKG